MNTTPLWVPIVVAAMGLVGTVAATVGGVCITQRLANRREQDSRELPGGLQTNTWEKLQHLELYASPRVAASASGAYNMRHNGAVGTETERIGAGASRRLS